MRSLVSIVIATRNRAGHLRRCLDAVRRSPPPPGWMVEVIVVDNGSTDGTATVVESACAVGSQPRVRYLVEPRKGKAFAVNAGTAAAGGSLLAFLDDDVEPDSRWLGEIVKRFHRDPDLGLLAGRVVAADAENTTATTYASEESEEKVLDPEGPLEGRVLGCNLAIRREVLAAVGGRDTRLGPGRGLAGEDIDFVYRVLRHGIRGHIEPQAMVVHRLGDRNRRVEYPRGRGAYYMKFIVQGDRTIARQAWWELSGLWRDFRRGVRRPSGSPLERAWHLSVGAAIMTARMLASPARAGDRRPPRR